MDNTDNLNTTSNQNATNLYDDINHHTHVAADNTPDLAKLIAIIN